MGPIEKGKHCLDVCEMFSFGLSVAAKIIQMYTQYIIFVVKTRQRVWLP